jgi:hypothetical protein
MVDHSSEIGVKTIIQISEDESIISHYIRIKVLSSFILAFKRLKHRCHHFISSVYRVLSMFQMPRNEGEDSVI